MESFAADTQNPDSSLPDWYCLRSQLKHENIAAIHLRKYAAVEVFSPRIRFQRPRLKGKAWMTEALFPGYLFARFHLQERWREIQYSHAVRGILRFGEKYPVVPTGIVEQLRALVGPEELAVVQQGMPAPGQEIIVAEGPFRGLQSVITGYLPAKERVKVLMNFFGQEMEIEMSAAAVAPIQPYHPLKSKFGLPEPDTRHGKGHQRGFAAGPTSADPTRYQ